MEHCVYVGKVGGRVVYVGMGKKIRPAHLNSGVSSCYHANKHHFAGGITEVEIILQGISQEEAVELELHLIREIDPPWNTIKPGMVGTGPDMIGRNFKKPLATSQYFGVSFNPANPKKPWRAWHRTGKQKNHIGYYSSEICAALARDKYLTDNNLPGKLNFGN